MAVITKRGKEQYQVKVRKTGYPAISQTFPTKALAEKWARKVESEMDSGTFQNTKEADTSKLSYFFSKYAEEIAVTKKSCSDIRSRLNTLNKHLGHYTLSTLSPLVVANYRDYRLDKSGKNPEQAIGNESVRKELSILNSVIKQCLTEWQVHIPHGNPLDKVKRPPKGKPRVRRLESPNGLSEEQLLLNQALQSKSVIGDILVFALETGMRRSEITKIERQDIDLKNRTIELFDTKNGDGRVVPLSPKAIEIIRKQKMAGNKLFDIRPDSVGQAFRRLRAKCGIKKLNFHDFRHEATSRFVELGLQPLEVASITGHKDLRTLMRYTHLRAEELAVKLANSARQG